MNFIIEILEGFRDGAAKRLSEIENHEAITWLMIMLLGVGAVNIFSSTFIMAENENSLPYAYLLKHLVSMTLGFILFFISWRVDYHKWRDWLGPVTIVIIILLIAVVLVGTAVNGAKRWIYLGPFSFQPAEFAKICSVMMAAYLLSYDVEHNKKLSIKNTIISKRFFMIFFLALLVELEPDMGTASVVAGIPLVMLGVAGLPWKEIKKLILIAVVGVAGLCVYQPYRLNRIISIINPWADAQGDGYQTVQSIIAIGSGGPWGMGLGQGLAKYAYLPEAHTDFAFAVFAQENGFFLVMAVLFIYALFAFFAFRVAQYSADIFGQLLACGIMILIVGQACVNLYMVSGCFPVVGVPLPFISYGGSSLMMNMFSVGILANISRYSYFKRKQRQLLKLKNEQTRLEKGPVRTGKPVLKRVK